MSTIRVLTFRNCIVRADAGLGFTETVFHDGARVPAYPTGLADQMKTCERLGYGADVFGMCREHEILHTWLCEQFGLPYSPTLWAVAHGQAEGSAPLWAQQEEESLVLSFQAFLNEVPHDERALESLHGRALQLSRLKEQARKMLRAA